MKRLYLIQAGIGTVGRNVINQLVKQHKEIKRNFQIDLVYSGIFNSSSGKFNKRGLPNEEVVKQINILNNSHSAVKSDHSINEAISFASDPFVFLDLTASDSTMPILLRVLKKGGYVVLSNKKPLAGKLEEFTYLHRVGRQKLFYETVVGAGLPVIQTLKNLITSGDEVFGITGCFSGTLGYIFSNLDNGRLFSEAVLEAIRKGYSEPDPRDDLFGADVARKVLILSRLLGFDTEMSDIKRKPFIPETMKKLDVNGFLERIKKLDNLFNKKVSQARKKNKVLRYVARIGDGEHCVELAEVDFNSDIGNLRGPDNIIIIRTKHYNNSPLVIKGPGAGGEVTAGGVLSDILNIARITRG